MRAPTLTLRTPEGRVVCERCELAATPLARMKGLLGRTCLRPGEGILLRPAPSVHTLFMRFPIDVVFLDRDLRVVRVVERLAPWRAASCRGARQALELPAGAVAWRRVAAGLQLVVDEPAGTRRAA
jgi:uncharacterized membrane protein (UPF0127 family)